MNIKPKYIHGRYSRKLGTYGPERNLFEKYEVGTIRTNDKGYTFIEIKGPKKTFSLISCAKQLTIISPPEVEGGNAIQKKVPLYFVSPMHGSGKLQGAEYFAEIDGELVAYRPAGGGTITPL
jgi:hypothetical protein